MSWSLSILSAVLIVCKSMSGPSHERGNICAGRKCDGPGHLTAKLSGLHDSLEYAEPAARSCTLAHEQQCPGRKGLLQTKPRIQNSAVGIISIMAYKSCNYASQRPVARMKHGSYILKVFKVLSFYPRHEHLKPPGTGSSRDRKSFAPLSLLASIHAGERRVGTFTLTSKPFPDAAVRHSRHSNFDCTTADDRRKLGKFGYTIESTY